jgi:hypothetical protein
MGYDRFFEQTRKAAGELDNSTIQKGLRMLAYGIPTDHVDDQLAMGESQAIKCVKRFATLIVRVFDKEYLRAPNINSILDKVVCRRCIFWRLLNRVLARAILLGV